MTLLEIYDQYQKEYPIDIFCIQGNKETLYCYGPKANELASDLNLPFQENNSKSVKLPASQIDKFEDHFLNYKYEFVILELFEPAKGDEFNKKIYEVKRSSNLKSIGLCFDNRNQNGSFPKRSKTSLHKILALELTSEVSTLVGDKGIILNDEQADIVAKINNWISGDNPIGILCGRAGTGKTTLLKFVAKLLEARKKTFSLLAPTGRAARILSKKTGIEAHTIHSEIYVLDTDAIKMSDDSDQQQQAFESSDFSIEFKLKAEENLSQFYIIDESSMVGDKKGAEGDLNFGTGRLLSDLLMQTGIVHRKNINTKILFVGDHAQLPPIKEDGSPALDKEYLLREFNLKYIPEYFELHKVLRQAKNSLILSNAEVIRTHISNKDFNHFHIQIDQTEVFTTTPTLAQSKALGSSISNNIMVTRSNKAAYHYNKSIRSKIFPNENVDKLQKGDLILVVNNSSQYNCCNGDIYIVVDLNENEKKEIRLEKSSQFKDSPEVVTLFYRDVIVRPVEFIDNEKYDKPIKIIENLLNKPEIFLDRTELIATHVDWNNRVRNKNLSIAEKKQELFTDPYLNAVQVKYAYAITCHKAQGGEWPNVSIFLEGMWANEGYYRWLYTAITRATSTLSFINLPKDFSQDHILTSTDNDLKEFT